jgi:hypothetical protein
VNRTLMQPVLKMRGGLLLFTITVTCSAWGALLAFTCGSWEVHDSRRTCLGVPPKVTHDRHYWYWSPRCSCQDWDVLLSPRLTFFSSLLTRLLRTLIVTSTYVSVTRRPLHCEQYPPWKSTASSAIKVRYVTLVATTSTFY